MNTSIFQIFFISFVFALIVGSGLYGFGNDFYAAYYKSNIHWGGIRDRLGWMISTFTIYKVHIGVYLVSFLLAISTGLIFIKTSYRYFEKNKLFFFACYIMLLHTWPIIMSTSNAMRQGVSMSFLFIALYFLLSKRYSWYLVSLVLVVMTHKSGILLASLLAGFNLCSNLIQNRFDSLYTHRNLLIITCFLSAIILYFVISLIFQNHVESKIIMGDYRYPFLLINTVYIFIYAKYLFIKFNQVDIFLLVCSFIFPVFLFHEFNWEYERLNMMILILYMISFSKIFVDRDKKTAILFATTLLLFMTVFTDMYTSLK